MAEVVQIDLVVNTTQLDVAEARYDALKARQLGLQGGSVAGGLSTPGAMAGAYVGALMARASQVQTVLNASTALQVAAPSALLSLEQATVAGFARHQQGLNLSAGWDFADRQLATGGMAAWEPKLSMDDPVVQNKFASDYFAAQYLRQTGRIPPNHISAANIREAIVRDQELVRSIVAANQSAGSTSSTGSTPSAGVAGPGKTAKAMWSKAKASILKVPGRTMSGSAAVLAFSVLDGVVDDTLQDADFRAAAGIKADDVTYMGGTVKQSVSSTLYDAHVMTYGRASRAFAMHPLAFMFSKSTMSERMQSIEKYNKSGGVVGWAATKIGLKNYSQDAVLKATETIARTKRELVGQHEWGEVFNKGMQDIEARAIRSSQDFMQRIYGGGDVDRWDAEEWVTPAVVRMQKEKFANEAWTKHPNARIAVDPPKE